MEHHFAESRAFHYLMAVLRNHIHHALLCSPAPSPQTYPLSNRGLRVVSGRNADEPGADSNGSGKTSLVTAPLWALTGDVLSRTEVRRGCCWVVRDGVRHATCGKKAFGGRGSGSDTAS